MHSPSPHRRSLVVGGTSALALAVTRSVRAVAPVTIAADATAMRSIVDPATPLDAVYSGGLWCEGPVWSTRRRTLIFSDVRRNTILALAPAGAATPVRSPSNFANGNAFDARGRLVSCEHLGRRIVREEADGRITVLADRHDGRRLNAPNDLAIAPDGAIWFTDPTFGLTQPEEGRMAMPEQRGRYVFRLAPDGTLRVVADSFEQPNGIVFSPDHRLLYVSDTSGDEGREGKREVRAFDVVGGERLVGERVFARVDAGVPDGLDVDRWGRVYAACQDGVRIWTAEGEPVGRIATPSTCGNLAFGGADGRRLFLCTGQTLHAITLKVAGAHR